MCVSETGDEKKQENEKTGQVTVGYMCHFCEEGQRLCIRFIIGRDIIN